MNVIERFLRYVTFETTSDEESETCPSTACQLVLADYLAEELRSIGVSGVVRDSNGYVYGKIPASDGMESAPVIGLIAHMDTSPDVSGKNVCPRIITYDGTNAEMLDAKYVGQEMIVSDTTTLLGADDKAGVAEIVTACERIIADSSLRHGAISICFTPDEEIGRGADRFDVKGFGADYAYTADGGPIGEIEYENFNAASAKVVFHGRNIHPGSAKDKMINSQYIAMEFQSLLPVAQKPEYTDGYEGFIHLTDMAGEVEESTLRYIVRDHDMEKFGQKKALLRSAADFINAKYGEGTCELSVQDSYYNMRGCIEPVMHIVTRAKDAMRAVGMEPREVPIRGGTDGARLSYEGLPCPNLCTGGDNYHGRFEFIPVEDMEKCVEMLIAILTNA